MVKQIVVYYFFLLGSINLYAQQYELIPINPDFDILIKYDIVLDKSHNLWVATDKGVLEYKDKKWKLYSNNDINFINITELFIDSKDRKWCISYSHNPLSYKYLGGLFMINQQGDIIDYSDNIESVFINDIEEDNQGNIWIATGRRLTGINNKKDHTFNTALKEIEGVPLTDLISKKIAKNASGGLYKFDGVTWQDYTSDGTMPIKFIDKIIKTKDDAIYFCEARHGKERLVKYDGESFMDLSKKKDYPGDEIEDIITDYEGNVWFFTADNRLKIFKLDSNNSLSEIFKMNPYRLGYGKFYKFNGNIYMSYLGTFMAYDKQNKTWICPKKQTNQKKKRFIRDIAPGADNTILIADGEGIRIYKNGEFIETRLLKKIDIRVLYSIDKDNILVGTKENGLFLINRNKTTPISVDSNGQKMPNGYSTLKVIDNNITYFNATNGILKVTTM